MGDGALPWVILLMVAAMMGFEWGEVGGGRERSIGLGRVESLGLGYGLLIGTVRERDRSVDYETF